MLNGNFVLDATTHPWNFGPDNSDRPGETSSWRRTKGLFLHHKMFTREGPYMLHEDELFSDFDYEGFAAALFVESPVDFAIIHSLPNLGFNKKDLVEADRVAVLRDTYPNRFLLYGNVTPIETNTSLKRLDYQAKELGIKGLKLYPAGVVGSKLVGWRMDDPNVAFPIFEKCLELGINNVAVHKAVTLGSTTLGMTDIHDMENAAKEFPNINFQIVHAGWAYLEETILLMERYENVFANLELTFSMIVKQPRMFAEIIGQMMFFHLEKQIIFADGCNAVHPRPGLEAFGDFKMPRDLVEDMGYREVDDDIKAMILHGNLARIHGLDVEQLKAGIQGDVFSERRGEGYAPPWSTLRERMGRETEPSTVRTGV